MESHRIALISDTHGLLRPEVVEKLKTCEIILHAGDIGKPEILRRLKEIAETYAVRGNVDEGRTGEFSEELPKELDVELWGFHIYVVHNKKHIRKDLQGVDIVVFGHSHRLSDEVCLPQRNKFDVEQGQVRDADALSDCGGGIRYLNPGSCGPKRFRLPVTMMILILYPAGHRIEVEKIDFLSAESEKKETVKIPGQDMHRLVREIMKEVDAGKNMAEIAKRNHIDVKFTEQVCRMYLTHPGVDVDGIMDRIERRNL